MWALAQERGCGQRREKQHTAQQIDVDGGVSEWETEREKEKEGERLLACMLDCCAKLHHDLITGIKNLSEDCLFVLNVICSAV